LTVSIAAAAGLLLLGYLALSFLAYYYGPSSTFHRNVQQPQLRSAHILATWVDGGFSSGTNEVVIAQILPCQNDDCAGSGAVFTDCIGETVNCVPPWKPVTAMPNSLLITPTDGYPPKYAAAMVKMLKDPKTKCTSTMEHPLQLDMGFAKWQTLCVNPSGLMLYRDVDQ
jgi:hypothetical protein